MAAAELVPLPKLKLGMVIVRLINGDELRVRAKDIVACRTTVHRYDQEENYQRMIAQQQMMLYRQYERELRNRGLDGQEIMQQINHRLPQPRPPETHIYIRVNGVDTEYRVSETLERIEEIMRDS